MIKHIREISAFKSKEHLIALSLKFFAYALKLKLQPNMNFKN